MYRYVASPAGKGFEIEPVRVITHRNLSSAGFKIASSTVLTETAYPAVTMQEIDALTGKKKQQVDALLRGVENIFNGLPFSVLAVGENGAMSGLVIQSSTRDHQYIVTEDGCQCEGHSNHGYCYHRALYPVFKTYVGMVRANEDFQRAHARLGIALAIADEPSIMLFGDHSGKTMEEVYEGILKEMPTGVRGS